MVKKLIMPNNRKGFTLPEIMVTTVVFILFSMSLLGILIMGMRYFNQAEADILAQQNCREVLEIITQELRQGNPCADPGQGANPSRGYLGVTPPLESTAVLYPNKNPDNNPGNYIEFTVPNYQTYDPADSSFDRFNPYYYKRVKYFTTQDGKTVRREVTTYTKGGDVDNNKTDDVAITETGQITLDFNMVSETTYKVSVTAVEGKSTYTGASTVYILVE